MTPVTEELLIDAPDLWYTARLKKAKWCDFIGPGVQVIEKIAVFSPVSLMRFRLAMSKLSVDPFAGITIETENNYGLSEEFDLRLQGSVRNELIVIIDNEPFVLRELFDRHLDGQTIDG